MPTERYVTSGAGGGGTGAATDPWTLAEGLAHAAAGDRVNVQSDAGYSLGADAVTNAGTISAPIIFRGYNSSIGDLDDQGRNADGTLDTTNMPDLTLTGILTMNQYVVLQNLDVTGALSSSLIGDTAIDDWSMISCRVVNMQNNSAARCLSGDDDCTLIQCDLECTGAAHNNNIIADNNTTCYGCRFKITADANAAALANGTIVKCVFIGNGSGTGVIFDATAQSWRSMRVFDSTFYNLDEAIRYTTGAASVTNMVCGCHVTDNAEYFNNSSGTTLFLLEAFNRLRDNTTPRTGLEPITIGEVTTDTGGAGTDYNDAASDDFRLIAAAPGYEAGMIPFTSIGPAHLADPAATTAVEVHNTLVTAPWVVESYR